MDRKAYLARLEPQKKQAWQMIEGGMDVKTISKLLDVHVSTVRRWREQLYEIGYQQPEIKTYNYTDEFKSWFAEEWNEAVRMIKRGRKLETCRR